MDVKGAYLNGILTETIYMKQPDGYENGTDQMCHLVKTLYSLKQAGREWNKELDAKLCQHKFTHLRSDPCAYVRRHVQNIEIITIWVADFLLFMSSQMLLDVLKAELQTEWEITDLGDPTKIVGIKITHTKNATMITQQKYVESILKRQGMDNANPVSMPMDPNVSLEPNPDGSQGNQSNSYMRLLGELQFLANATRPDIAYAVNRLATYTANFSMQHSTALKRLLRYLVGTKAYGITYQKYPTTNDVEENLFYGFSDAAYTNMDDHKSMSGYVFSMGGGAITWGSRKQTTVALLLNTEYKGFM
jgi:hypothetical protein